MNTQYDEKIREKTWLYYSLLTDVTNKLNKQLGSDLMESTTKYISKINITNDVFNVVRNNMSLVVENVGNVTILYTELYKIKSYSFYKCFTYNVTKSALKSLTY